MAIHLTSTGVVYDATNSPAQAAGTGSANTFDDYEEGAWTPASSQVTVQSVSLARYIKTGDLVWMNMYIHAVSGNGQTCEFTACPFTTISNGHTNGVVNMSSANSTVTNPHIRMQQGAAAFLFRQNNDSGLAGNEIDSGHVIADITYMTA